MNSAFCRTALHLHETFTGRRIFERLEELNHTQWLSQGELLGLQRKKLKHLIEYAYEYVPYYRRNFDKVGFHPDDLQKDFAYLNKLPILTKAMIRENFQDLLTNDPKHRQQLSKSSTSGSTGQPLVFMQDPFFRDSVTADIQRHMGWAGWKLGDLQALIWGVSFTRGFQQKVRTQLIDWVWNRFQTNAFQMTEETMTVFAKRLQKQKPRILFGYATCINQFAQFINQSPYKDITFDGIFVTAELLIPPVRQFIEETFHCKVYNRYGTLELGGIACECSAHTGLHISMENNYVEILRNGLPTEPGEVGEIIVTNLNNLGMPFIRYQIGDEGGWYECEHCSCGRALPMLKNIEGRISEMFQTQDGRIVRAAFSSGFRCLAHPSIKQFQVIQKSLDKMVVRLVPDGEVPQSTLDDISKAIWIAFGEKITVDFQFLDKILPLPSGKHQYAVSELNTHQNNDQFNKKF